MSMTSSILSKGSRLSSLRRVSLFVARLLVVCTLIITVTMIGQVTSQQRASASSVQCAWPRCTLYLNRAESYNFAYGAYTPSAPGPIMAAIILLRQGLGFFARSYVNRGYCLKFQV